MTPLPAPDGSLRARSAPKAATLGSRADGAVASVDTTAGPIVLSHPGAAVAPAVVAKASVHYRGAVAGRDLVLQLTPDGFKETVVLPGPLAAPTYLDRFALPAGVGARQGDQGVEFTDAAGKVVATFGGGFAFDAAFPAGGADTSAPVTTRLVAAPSAADPAATVEVAISDPTWILKPGRAFPVKVDPGFWQNTSSGQGRETYVTSGPWANSSFGTSTAVVSGADPNYYVSRTLIWFNLGSLPSATRVVTSAAMGVYNHRAQVRKALGFRSSTLTFSTEFEARDSQPCGATPLTQRRAERRSRSPRLSHNRRPRHTRLEIYSPHRPRGAGGRRHFQTRGHLPPQGLRAFVGSLSPYSPIPSPPTAQISTRSGHNSSALYSSVGMRSRALVRSSSVGRV